MQEQETKDDQRIVISMPSNTTPAIAVQQFAGNFLKKGHFFIDAIYEQDKNDKFGTRIKKRLLKIKPPPDGTKQELEWRGKNLSVWREVEKKVVGCGNSGPKKFDTTYISSAELSIKELKQFILENYEKNQAKSSKKMISLKIFSGSYWDPRGSLPKRPLDSLFLPKKDIDSLFSILDEFINEKGDYYKFQIPYKKVVLLEGIPGSGKTSLIFTVASHYERDIYIMPLTDDTDDYLLTNALSNVRPGSILVLEDIDSIFQGDSAGPKITLSGITNILDGLSRIDNLWIFLTSNDKDSLPDVVLRDGRIEHIVHFSYIKRPEIEKLVQSSFREKWSEQDKNRLIDRLCNICEIHKLAASTCVYFLFEHRHSDVNTVIQNLGQLKEQKKEEGWKSNNIFL